MQKIVYIHVPKCGGSSFGAALRFQSLLSQATITLGQGDPALSGEARIVSDYAVRRLQLRSLVEDGVRVIAGHVQYDRHLHLTAASDYRFVTLLRDPVDRFVSHYDYLQRRHPDPARPDRIEAFLDTRDAARLASQYLFYFAGVSRTMVSDPAVAEARAIDNLRSFALVGRLDEPEEFLSGLRRLTGRRLTYLKRNVAPTRVHLSDALRRRIEQLCASDLEIYEASGSSSRAVA